MDAPVGDFPWPWLGPPPLGLRRYQASIVPMQVPGEMNSTQILDMGSIFHSNEYYIVKNLIWL